MRLLQNNQVSLNIIVKEMRFLQWISTYFLEWQGGVIIDPPNGYSGYTYSTYDNNDNKINRTVNPDAKEIQFIFSEWYLTNDGIYKSDCNVQSPANVYYCKWYSIWI